MLKDDPSPTYPNGPSSGSGGFWIALVSCAVIDTLTLSPLLSLSGAIFRPVLIAEGSVLTGGIGEVGKWAFEATWLAELWAVTVLVDSHLLDSDFVTVDDIIHR